MNRLIFAGCPGGGKTTTLLRYLDKHLAEGVPVQEIAFLTFTRRARREALERVERKLGITAKDLPYFRTAHAMCYRALGLKDGDVVTRSHLTEFGSRMGVTIGDISATEQAAEALDSGEKGDQMLAIDNLARLRGQSLLQVWREAGTTLEWPVVSQFCRSYKSFKEEMGILDFTDVLQEFVNRGTTLPVAIAFIDEAQDLSRLQWQAALQACSRARQQYVAGDDMQCQPAGTLVSTPTGKRPIESLRNGDAVLSYSRSWSGVTGQRKRIPVQRASRQYGGALFTFSVGNNRTRTTAEHLCLVRFSMDARERKVVYLMRRGNNYRIGQTQLVMKSGPVMLGLKLRCERAQDIWVLQVCASAQEAHFYEQKIAHQYGLPQLRFVAGDGLLSQDQIDAVHATRSTKNAAHECLEDYGLSMKHPFWTAKRAATKLGGGAIFSIEAVNVLPDLMEMMDESMAWHPVKCQRTMLAKPITVYSLDVPKHHNYFADGILTHNCIFRWAGADVEQFMSLGGVRSVLDHSYRLPRVISALAQRVGKRVKHRIDKEFTPRDADGVIKRHASLAGLRVLPGEEWLWLVRNRYLIASLRDHLEEEGLVYSQHGASSISQTDRDNILHWTRLMSGQAISATAARNIYKGLLSRSQVDFGHKTLPDAADDAMLTLVDLKRDHGLLTEGKWFDVLGKITTEKRMYYRRLLRHHGTLDLPPQVQLETIHGAKGTEANNVALFMDCSRRVWEGMNKSPDDEHRVWYVGATRAREALHLVEGRGKWAYAI